eukprot:714655-Pyramimonas_sp.AAC.1
MRRQHPLFVRGEDACLSEDVQQSRQRPGVAEPTQVAWMHASWLAGLGHEGPARLSGLLWLKEVLPMFMASLLDGRGDSRMQCVACLIWLFRGTYVP